MTTRGFLLLAVLTVFAGREAQAQRISVTPNPVPLDGPLTIHVTGLQPMGAVDFGWDEAKPGWGHGNILISGSNLPTADANGNLDFTLDRLPVRVYPAAVGQHVLTASYFPAFSQNQPTNPNTGGFDAYIQIPVTVAPRAGWPASAPFPTKTSKTVTGGLLAFLNYSPDHSVTSLALSDGASTKIWGSFPKGAVIAQPAWSPDGSHLAFSAVVDTSPDGNLYGIDRAGRETQITANGGTPPKLTGGGPGSVAGSAVPVPLTMTYHPADQENCGELLQAPRFPDVVYVNLVGSGISTVVTLPPGGKGGDPFPFRFDNVPEGDYSVHMSATIAYCREYTIANPATVNDPNAKALLVVHDRTQAVLNSTLSAHVIAGQATQIDPGQMVDLYHNVSPPTWVDGGTLDYSFDTGDSLGISSSDIWTVPLGGAPVQLTNSLLTANPPFPKVHNPEVSPVTKRFAAVSDNLESGIFVADADSNISTTNKGVTSPVTIKYVTSYQLFIVDDHPAWSPDGVSYIAFIRLNIPTNNQLPIVGIDPISQANSTTGGLLGDLWFKDVSTGEEGGTTLNVAKGEGYFGRPAWSPDGTQVAVSYTPDNFKTVNIRIVNVADASFFDLTTDGRSALPTWTGQAKAADFPANAAFQPNSQTPPAATPGDISGDGKVNVSDATLALQLAVGIINGTPAQIKAADVNGDGKVDIRDATAILRLAVGLG